MNATSSKGDGRHIYFVTVRLGVDVHVQALGFTKSVFEFAYADTAEAAQSLARQHYAKRKLPVEMVAASYAIQQDPAQYMHPEKILRDRPFAETWRGEVAVHPDHLSMLTKIGASKEAQLGEKLFVFSAPEAVAVRINRSSVCYIGMLKPCMLGGPALTESGSKLAA